MTAQADARAQALAVEPLRPAGSQKGLATGTVQSIRNIWAHRELLGMLTRRELKARYKDSMLGFFWSLMRPLMMLIVYYVAIGKFLGAEKVPGRPGGIPSFAIYIFTGLTAWQFFNELVQSGTGSIVANGGLIKKVYLPREVFPLSALGSALFNFAVQLAVLVAATFAFGEPPSGRQLLYLPLSFLVLVVFGTAIALVLSAVNVYLRDIQYLIEIALMVLFWASPVVYSWTQVSNHFGNSPLGQIYLANPVTQAVLGFQRAFWVAGRDEPFPAGMASRLSVTLAVSVLLLWICQRVFARLQGNFAQEL